MISVAIHSTVIYDLCVLLPSIVWKFSALLFFNKYFYLSNIEGKKSPVFKNNPSVMIAYALPSPSA